MEHPGSTRTSENGKQTFLVTGATGTVGRHVVAELLKRNKKVRISTRNPAKAEFPEGVEVVGGDLNAPDTLIAALKGVTGVHLITFGDEEYTPLDTGATIAKLIFDAGVKRATILWGGENKKGSLEQAIETSNLEWTTLQPQEYMANALTWRESIIEEGLVREPCSRRKTAVVHEADIGAVAATILSEGGHAGKIHTLTGPEVLTPLKQVETISQVINRDIRFIELSEFEAKNRWRAMGFSEELMNYLYNWYSNPPAEGYTVISTVEEILKRPPRTFAEWAKDHAEAFR